MYVVLFDSYDIHIDWLVYLKRLHDSNQLVYIFVVVVMLNNLIDCQNVVLLVQLLLE